MFELETTTGDFLAIFEIHLSTLITITGCTSPIRIMASLRVSGILSNSSSDYTSQSHIQVMLAVNALPTYCRKGIIATLKVAMILLLCHPWCIAQITKDSELLPS